MIKKIKTFFKNHPQLSIKVRELAKRLDATETEEYTQLKQALHQLQKEGYLERQGKRFRFNHVEEDKLVGTLQIVAEGNFGFVKLPTSRMNDIFIPAKYLDTAFDGDTVEVSLLAKKRGKNIEGQIIDIIKRGREEIVGTLHKAKSFYFVSPDEKNIHRDIYIPKEFLKGAEDGDKVAVNDIEWKSHLINPEGKISEIYGKAGSHDAEIAAIAKEFKIAYKFPEAVLNEAANITTDIPQEEIDIRLDLRNEKVITIDPEDAKDFDDAVSITPLDNGNFSVGIHIADVSHYVNEGSEIYKESLKRGTSVYLVGKVIPMLPEHLSNKICSLVPNEDRLTYSVIAELTAKGKVVQYEIRKSIINSKRRFTYKEAQEILEGKESEFSEELTQLNAIARALRKNRMKTGSINFYTPEVEFELSDDGSPLNIVIKEIKESNNLIEEFMLLANQVIAKHVNLINKKDPPPFVYRIHDLPDEEKLVEFASFVKSLGYSFDPGSANKSKEFQKILEEVKGTEEEAVVNEVAIRSMAKAVYAPENIGHYGLGFKYYTHFTSPIRRFPDLIVHKLIHNYTSEPGKRVYSYGKLENICDHSSAQERNAVNAERLSVKLKQVEYMSNKVGDIFCGVISGITHFGIFVELNQTLAEGLIHLRNMKNDFYLFDEKQYALIGQDTGKKYRLGDRVKVQLIRVNTEKKEIDFVLLDE